ncbi:glutaredoxin 3 [Geoalkalibacter ferrihydriticus]|uniref:Glutaredoxin n=2 Tax=Geoalkalibacter ferrihydriticus TaxID=392333 RepID=A0A0C2EFW9_9BACT|nr:glutaredoxin 3 [Geoalkalibacter ferrihydriticus]KIH77528.1 glutaredoxin [Geoalkalibacter ferrihydriticus DSM 17813]SDL66213.1 glutaredoxin 3 [Geoalkalibacter ferrihydriticus]
MKRVEIYTKSYCPYCKRAKELLHIKGIDYIEYDVTDDPRKEQEMRQRSGRTTVPEVFIEDRLVGGCSDLFEFDEKGELDKMLGLSAPRSGESPS